METSGKLTICSQGSVHQQQLIPWPPAREPIAGAYQLGVRLATWYPRKATRCDKNSSGRLRRHTSYSRQARESWLYFPPLCVSGSGNGDVANTAVITVTTPLSINHWRLASSKSEHLSDMSSEKQPPGGLDKTPLPAPREQGYTLRITFHKAWNIPVSDFGGRSSDPYVLAQINTSLPTRHAHDPPVRYRSPTIHRSLKPEFNAQWVVAGVPASGMELKVRLYDEDANDHDDRLGKFDVTTGEISESWKGIHEQEYKVHKTGANFRAYTLRSCRMLVDRNQELHARMVISVEVLGKTKEDLGKVYTVNNFWRQHFSPVIGRLAGTKANNDQGVEKFE